MMKFILALALLLHGAYSLVATKVRIHPFYTLFPKAITDLLEKYFPSAVYSISYDAQDEPNAGQSWLVGAGEIGVGVYLLYHHRK